MKNMTIWQRLNTALLILILLLLTGVGLAVWIEKARSNAVHNSDELDLRRDRIKMDVVMIGDAVRGLLLDPKNDPDRKRRADAEKDLTINLDAVQTDFAGHPNLIVAVHKLHEFVAGSLAPFEREVSEQARRDAASA